MIRDMVGPDGKVREKDRDAVQFVKSKIDSAKWFISAIKQRHDTLMRTMQTILDYQQEYFKDGDRSKLRPMILKDIADRTGLDVSTISRVVNSKYVQTQFGIILLNQAHSAGVHRRGGQAPSADRRDAHGHPQCQGIPHRAAHGGQVPRDARHPRGAPAQANLTMNNYKKKLAHGLSWMLHPFVLPLYMIVVLLTLTVFAHYSTGVKCYLLWVVVLYAIVIPALSLGVLRSLGRISSYRVDERRERLLPLLIGAICYVLCAITIARIPSAAFLRKFMLAAACCEVMCLVVSSYWKISLHLTGMGAVVALLVVMNILGVGNMMIPLMVAILLAGALASARLYLGCHNAAQVLAGFCGGFVVTVLAVLFL